MFLQQWPIAGRLKLSLSVACFGLGICLLVGPSPVHASTFRVTPAKVLLNDNFALAKLIVTKADARGDFSDRSDDLTTTARYAS